MATLPESVAGEKKDSAAGLDPRAGMHIPIGLPNTVDTLKTFVEAEGCFSPGFGSYGLYFWLYDSAAGKLTAPTMPGVSCAHGLLRKDSLIPWSAWEAAGLAVRSEVCEVRRESPAGEVFIVGARVILTNSGQEARKVALYAALRPLGPAGFAVKDLSVSEDGTALLVDGHPALVANQAPSGAGVAATDAVGQAALAGKLPAEKSATSENGDCSGALCFDVELAPGAAKTFGFVCPVLPGRRAVGHQWGPGGKDNYKELAQPNPPEGGSLQPDPGLKYYQRLDAAKLFEEAAAGWQGLLGRVKLKLPDVRWEECFAATAAHVTLCLNEGAPDASVINYTTFNRDAVYNVNIFQKAGLNELATEAIGHFLKHPFNGRPYAEADNPGQDLWILAEHWRFTRDREWLEKVYPSARKLAALIRYYRTTPPPHWVNLNGLEFGEAVPKEQRAEFKLGRCDGSHPEYTEAFDLAGLRAGVLLAQGLSQADDATAWGTLAGQLFGEYGKKFGARLPKDYGSYSMLWPCRLYPLESGPAHEQFRNVGAQQPGGWRYFPLATAHQGLLAGNRAAGHGTLARHLDHEQMRGWYAFDEGPYSGPGGWGYVRTKWKPDRAMPHGWAIAEVFLLLRDSLLFEDGERIVLLGGVPEDWFTPKGTWGFTDLPTHFGKCSLSYEPKTEGATVKLSGATPPQGFVLRATASLKAEFTCEGKPLARAANGDVAAPAGTETVEIRFSR